MDFCPKTTLKALYEEPYVDADPQQESKEGRD
jgi:hypothetical protein